MANRRSPSQIPDGSATGSGSTVDRWKYTCRLCGVAFFEAVHPDSMTDPLCHACYTGRRKGPRTPTQRGMEADDIELDDIELDDIDPDDIDPDDIDPDDIDPDDIDPDDIDPDDIELDDIELGGNELWGNELGGNDDGC